MRRRIRTLEQRFGRRLFVRNEGSWKVAPDLRTLLDAAQRMEDAARNFSQYPNDSGGMIRISVLDAFAQRLCPVFARLREKHPRIQLSITTEGYFVDLEQEQVDIAIRLARPVRNGGALRIRKIGDIPVKAYASSEYLDRHDGAARDRRFTDHKLLAINTHFSHLNHEFPYALLSSEMLGIRGQILMSSDSFSVLARLCELGFGVAILPICYAKERPALEVIQDGGPTTTTELWMVSRFDFRAGWQRDLAAMLQAELARWSR